MGYSVRFDNNTAPQTRIKFLTDGCLVRECLTDPDLCAYSILMLDEAHERSINTDILLGLIQRVMKARCGPHPATVPLRPHCCRSPRLAPRRPSLRVIVTSATLQTAKFASYFGNCPILTIPGRVYPVDIFHSRARVKASNRRSLVDAVVRLVMRIHMEEEDGHVLVFLTGQEEIEQACAALRSQFEEEVRPPHRDAPIPRTRPAARSPPSFSAPRAGAPRSGRATARTRTSSATWRCSRCTARCRRSGRRPCSARWRLGAARWW